MNGLFTWYNAGASMPDPRFGYAALVPWDTTNRDVARGLGLKVLAYQNAAWCNTISQNGLYPSGVSYPEAAANGWALLTTSGQLIEHNNMPWYYAGDIGNADYQRAWATNVIELLAGGWDGVFIDDVNPSMSGEFPPVPVAKYSADAQYGAAMGSFVQTVGPLIQDAGKVAIANVSQSVKFASVVQPWFGEVSGWMDEQLSPGKLFLVTT